MPIDGGAKAPEVTVLMPCLNERRTLAGCIVEARSALARAGLEGEIVVADNGSTDGSQALANSLGARVVPVADKGYGNALLGGIDAARGKYIVMGDADGSYDFGHLDRFVAALRQGADLAMGNRFLGGIQPGAMPWKNRYIGNPLLSFVGRMLFRGSVRDYHCGLRGFSAAAVRGLDLRTTGMEFASEMVIKAQLAHLRIVEVPTILRPDGRDRPPHLRPWRDGWRHLRFMLLFSPRWLFLYPGYSLIVVGAVLGARLTLSPLRLFGRISLDVDTLFFCAVATVLGVQSVFFALLTKVFAIRQGLRPADPDFDRWLSRASLETGLMAGGAMALAGLGLSLGAVWFWGQQRFGELNPTQVLRWVIPSGTLLMIGCQTILSSFFLSVLGLTQRRGSAARLTGSTTSAGT